MSNPEETFKKYGDKKETSADKTGGYLPSISLPKGGGAIRGVEEKYSVNPVTGSASFNIPIYTTPGRSDFFPKLSLSYDSGHGSGSFGLGWSLFLPSITRKTEKGLPQYRDKEDRTYLFCRARKILSPILKILIINGRVRLPSVKTANLISIIIDPGLRACLPA